MKNRILFITIAILILCAVALNMLACNAKLPTNTENDNEDYISDTIRYYKTNERNVEEGSMGSTRILTQKNLINENNLIIRGVYLYDENFTLEIDRQFDWVNRSLEIFTEIHYYTYYKFRVAEVLKGDKSFENTEIYFVSENRPSGAYNIIFREGEEYFVFTEYYADDDLGYFAEVKPLIKTDYFFSPSQRAFPIEDNYVYSTKMLIDYDNFISENCDNKFMNDWIKKQITEKVPLIPDKNLEDGKGDLEITDANNINTSMSKNDIIKDWRIETIPTRNGESERICIPLEVFTDFLKSAIEYYK